MICYKDKCFCSRVCENKRCELNYRNIPLPVDLPICVREIKECKDYKAPNEDAMKGGNE